MKQKRLGLILIAISASAFANDQSQDKSNNYGNISIFVGGTIQADAAYVNDDKSNLIAGPNTEIRRARLFVRGMLYEDWGYKLRVGFEGDNASFKDAYLKYNPAGITFGLFKPGFSIDEMISSKHITFMERALPNAFKPGRRYGVGYHGHTKRLSFTANLFERGTGDGDSGDEGLGMSVRLTGTPYLNGNKILHFGLNSTLEQPEDNDKNTVRFRVRPESHLARRLVDTGTITDVKYINRNALEIAMVADVFSFQGEYMFINIDRDNDQEDLTFNGAYLYFSWFMSGESRPYNMRKGNFGRIRPVSRSGAWELALRYSHIDLNSNSITGGTENNIALGLNWYVNPRVRFSANMIFVDTDEYAGNEDPQIFQLRGQIDFEV